MSLMVRQNPETPCQPNGAHHPHRWVCIDEDCGCDWLDGRHYSRLECCVDGQDWPCETKRAHSEKSAP